MADIANALNKLNTDEVAQNKPTSEALFSKMGAAINGLIERPFGFEVKTTSGNWVCPDNVFTVLVIGVGGGGGGGGGGDATNSGGNGGGGNATTFNAQTIAAGGAGGERGSARNALYATVTGGTVVQNINGGRGRGGGQSGAISVGAGGAEGVGGAGALSLLAFTGSSYGAGGAGGGSGDGAQAAGGGAGGGAGQIGFRLFAVTPGTSYSFVIGSGGSAGAKAPDPFADAGAAGSAGALALFYMSE